MNKKVINYVIIGLLAVLLALFLGIFLGNRNANNNTNNGTYTPPPIEDNRGDGVQDPDLGTVEDDENYVGEKYYLTANNSSSDNFNYFLNSSSLDPDNDFSAAQLLGMFNATYTADLSASTFITVGRLEGSETHSNLVYTKFSTYLGKYNGSDLVSSVPAMVMFGFEQTVDNQYHLRYAFCTYGDRGEIYSEILIIEGTRDPMSFSFKFRVPYLLTSNYEEVLQLFSLNGLTKDGYSYKLLNNENDQYYIESNALSIVASLTKYIVNQNLSMEDNKTYLYNVDLSKYIKLNNVEYDYVLSSYAYIKDTLSLNKTNPMDVDYFEDNKTLMPGTTIYSLHHWFNNKNSIYNVPLVDVVV